MRGELTQPFFSRRHNAAALTLVKLVTHQLPKAVNIAYFDTTFHTRSIPPHVYTYPLDPEMAQKKMIRKYGFHGISYSFVLREAAEFLQKVRCPRPALPSFTDVLSTTSIPPYDSLWRKFR